MVVFPKKQGLKYHTTPSMYIRFW